MVADQPRVFRYQGLAPMFYVLLLIAGVSAVMFPLIWVFDGAPGQVPVQFGTRHVAQSGTTGLYMPAWAAMGVLFPLSMGLCLWLLVFVWRKWHNERIVVQNGVITWTDAKGRPRVSCPLSQVLPGPLQQSGSRLYSASQRSAQWYTVHTPHGDISWNDSIDNCDDLVGIVEKAHQTAQLGASLDPVSAFPEQSCLSPASQQTAQSQAANPFDPVSAFPEQSYLAPKTQPAQPQTRPQREAPASTPFESREETPFDPPVGQPYSSPFLPPTQRPTPQPHDAAGIHIMGGPNVDPALLRHYFSGARTYDYRQGKLLLVAGFLLLWSGLVIPFATNAAVAIANGQDPHIYTGRYSHTPVQHPAPFVAIFLIVGLIALGGALYCIGLYLNGKVIFDGQDAIVHDWMGGARGHFSFRNIRPEDLSMNRSYNRGQVFFSFRARTPTGTMKWSDALNGAGELYDSLRALAGEAPADLPID